MGMPWHSTGQGDGQEADDGRRLVDPAPATSAEAQPRCITIGIADLYSSMPAVVSTPRRAVRLTTWTNYNYLSSYQ